MKFLKTKYIIIFTILLLALAFGSIIFLKEARKSNTWPFNAKMGHYFPSEFKKFVYDISNPSNKTVESLYYNLSIKYFRIKVNFTYA